MESSNRSTISHFGPIGLVLLSTAIFGFINARNAHLAAPVWGQDLAFFHQLIHSAATGGPWASPLLLEPQGFFDMVHTHLVLPLVVGVYWLWPHQNVLLYSQAFFASLALWPAWRLAEVCGAQRWAWLAPSSLMVFGPFQGAAMADFRPSVLFIPGVLGLFYGAAARRPRTAMTWALVALSGRQEAAWLIGLSGLCLWLIPWPNISTGPDWWSRWQRGRANQIAWLAMGVGLLALGGWILTKDQMFFHFNPTQPEATPRLAPEHLQDRWDYVTRLARSGWILGLISPGSLLAMIPIGHEMAGTAREWPQMVGPAAHYSAFWLPFVTASGIAGACRIRKWGLPILVLLNTLAFPWVSPRTGDPSLQRLAEPISADDRVAADYDSIHLVSGRRVLWNVEQLNLPDDERPYEWNQAWPLKTDDVDVIILRRDHPLTADLVDWTIIAETETHLSLRLR